MQTSDKVAAVGMGRMGRGIAVTFACAGMPVSLVDLKPRPADDFAILCDAARAEISKTLGMLADFGLFDASAVDALTELVTYHSEQDSAVALGKATIVFEGVPETLAAKEAALRLVSEHAKPEAIVASTTSTILSDELQAMVSNPERFLNAHWLNPAYLVPLVELSPGQQTDPGVTEKLKVMLERIGKVPVVCTASPGYIVPRIQALAMNEAARMVEEGVASVEDIDKATRYGFGFRFAVLGLLEFIDWGGGDILYHASRYMVNATGEDRFQAPDIITDNMSQGRIGLSTLKGFLDYEGRDIPAYQRERLAAFVALLRHINQLPRNAGSTEASTRAQRKAPIPTGPAKIVRAYLSAMENRDLAAASAQLAEGFNMTFPGGVSFTRPEELVAWASTRYRSVGKTYDRFDECSSETESTVYCYGTLQGEWLDGSHFSGIRFIDRFTLKDNLITSQLVWNDLAESINQATSS